MFFFFSGGGGGTNLLTPLPAARLLVGQGGLGGHGLAADGVVRRSQTFARVVEVARLGGVQAGVTGFPSFRAGAHFCQG